MDGSIIVTYRCPMRCKMCNIWANPTKPSEEFAPELLEKLPRMHSVNITGGEPFIREDIEEIVKILRKKTNRIVFSTSGWFSDRIIALAKKYPDLGFRISIEGLSVKNDELRGREGGFDKGLRTLLELRRMGVKDIGFGITVSNNNSDDMLDLYELNKNLKMEFATASFHNSFYFHKYDNQVTNLGKFLDPLADKLLVTAALMMFVGWGQMPAWAALVVITREFAVTGLRLIAVEKGIVIAAGWSGKVKTASSLVCICLMLLPLHSNVLFAGITVDALCIAVIVITTLWSGIEYFAGNLGVFSED